MFMHVVLLWEVVKPLNRSPVRQTWGCRSGLKDYNLLGFLISGAVIDHTHSPYRCG